MTQDIAIVGRGAVGTSALIHLIDALTLHPPPKKVRVHTINPDGYVGKGLAYSRD